MLKGKTVSACIAFIVMLVMAFILIKIEMQPAPIPFYLEYRGETRTERYACWRGEKQQCYVFIPGFVDLSKTQIVMNTSDAVYVNGERLSENTDCSAFQVDCAYDMVYCGTGVEEKLQLTFLQSGEMAAVHIDTETGNMNYVHAKKGNEEKAEIRIYSPSGELDCEQSLKSIVARGNSTFPEEKKPYIIRFSEPTNVLNIGTAQKWILLANAFDITNMRNYIVMNAAKRLNMPYTPDMQWIELYLNSEYVGVYLLSEKIEVHEERVDIPAENSYLFSLEDRGRIITQNLPHYETHAGQTARIRYPEVMDETTKEELSSLIQMAENAILSEKGIDPVSGKLWDALIDVNSWARKYLIDEVFANVDAGKWSQYFYMVGGEQRIYAGPVWDYDISLALSWQTSIPNAWFCNRLKVSNRSATPWFFELCKKPEFMQRVAEIYETEFLPVLRELCEGGIEQLGSSIFRSNERNAVRWSMTADVENEVVRIEEYLCERIAFLNDVWIEQKEYVRITAHVGEADGYIHLAVPAGSVVENLPVPQVDDFYGWYLAEDGTEIHSGIVMDKDVEIYALRSSGSSAQDTGRIKKLIPLGVIALLGAALAIADFCHQRRT